jgi:hypothetical protein
MLCNVCFVKPSRLSTIYLATKLKRRNKHVNLTKTTALMTVTIVTGLPGPKK